MSVNLFKQFNDKYLNLLDNLCKFFGDSDQVVAEERKWAKLHITADSSTHVVYDALKDIPEQAVELLQAADPSVFELYPDLPLTTRTNFQFSLKRCVDDEERKQVWAMIKPTIGVLCTVDVLGNQHSQSGLRNVAEKLKQSNLMDDIKGKPPSEAMQMLLPKLLSQDGLMNVVGEAIFDGGDQSVFTSIMQNSGKLLKGMNLDIPIDLPEAEDTTTTDKDGNSGDTDKAEASSVVDGGDVEAPKETTVPCPDSLVLSGLSDPPAPSAVFKRQNNKKKKRQKQKSKASTNKKQSLSALLQTLKGDDSDLAEVQSSIQTMLKSGNCAADLQQVMSGVLSGGHDLSKLMVNAQSS